MSTEPNLTGEESEARKELLEKGAQFSGVTTPDQGSYTRPPIRDLLEYDRYMASRGKKAIKQIGVSVVQLPGAH